jgi:hypothetical protein
MEALVLEPAYRPLFDEAEQAGAARRLPGAPSRPAA